MLLVVSLRRGGFTVVELLVVILVIGILASVTVVAYSGVRERATLDRINSNLMSIKKGLALYRADTGKYPNACGAEGAACAVSSLSSYLVPGYMSALPDAGVSLSYVYASASPYSSYSPQLNEESYGINVAYPAGACKTGNNLDSRWWGIPNCPN